MQIAKNNFNKNINNKNILLKIIKYLKIVFICKIILIILKIINKKYLLGE